MKKTKFENDKMSDSTYKEKRQVMKIIYNAKKYSPSLPRIEVKIGKAKGNYLGFGRLGENQIWIDVKKINKSQLVQVVLHEILHAVFATPHKDTCKLMAPTVQKITEKKAWEIFRQYIDKYKQDLGCQN